MPSQRRPSSRASRRPAFALPLGVLLVCCQLLLPAGLFAHEVLEHGSGEPPAEVVKLLAKLSGNRASSAGHPAHRTHHGHGSDDCGVCQTVGHQHSAAVPPAAVVDCGPARSTRLTDAPATVHAAAVPLDSASPRAPPLG